MNEPISFNRLILLEVLRQVSPMVIRLLSVSDRMELSEFHRVIRLVFGWKNDLDYIVRVHGKEFNSFRRKTQAKALHELKLHRQEKFLYVHDTSHMWEWDYVRAQSFLSAGLQAEISRVPGLNYLGIARRKLPRQREQGNCHEGRCQNRIKRSIPPVTFHQCAYAFSLNYAA